MAKSWEGVVAYYPAKTLVGPGEWHDGADFLHTAGAGYYRWEKYGRDWSLVGPFKTATGAAPKAAKRNPKRTTMDRDQTLRAFQIACVSGSNDDFVFWRDEAREAGNSRADMDFVERTGKLPARRASAARALR